MRISDWSSDVCSSDLLVDIDRLDELDARLRLFSHNRFNLLALHDRDHGDGTSLRAWAERVLCEHGVALAGGRIRLLAFPRVLGRVFNPISLWRSEEHTSELQSLMRISYAVFCLNKKKPT